MMITDLNVYACITKECACINENARWDRCMECSLQE